MSKLPFISRRAFMIGTGTAAAGLGMRSAWAQGRLRIDPGEFQPLPIAIPNFVGGSPADDGVGGGITGVITNNLLVEAQWSKKDFSIVGGL